MQIRIQLKYQEECKKNAYNSAKKEKQWRNYMKKHHSHVLS